MKPRLLITPTALRDLQQGIDYYNSRQSGLGKRFAKTISDTFSRIQKMPEAASFAYDAVRYKVTASFPYIILYVIVQDSIQVLRVFNTHQEPEDRTEQRR